MKRALKTWTKNPNGIRLYMQTSLTNSTAVNFKTYLKNDVVSSSPFSRPIHWKSQLRFYVKPNNKYLDGSKFKDHELRENIGSCYNVSRMKELAPEKKEINDGTYRIYFLGTSAGQPTRERMCSATLLRVHGEGLLFDAAEGVLRQLSFTPGTRTCVTNIFITHLHGDHLFGLPSLLLSLQSSSRSIEKSGSAEGLTINVYGPPGLYNYIAMSFSLTMSTLTSGKIIVHELVGGHSDPGPDPVKEDKRGDMINPRHQNYPELSRKNLFHKTLQKEEDGTWNFELHRERTFNERGNVRLLISAGEVKHRKNVMTFGYVVQEKHPPNIDPEKATNLGVKPSKKYDLLKDGISVQSDDGTHMVHPEQVLLESKMKARKFALIGDSNQLSLPLYKLCQDCDVLVHEATSMEKDARTAAKRGHSTPGIAGFVAKNVNAKVLVLYHLGGAAQRLEDEVVKSAKRTNSGRSHIIAAHDFMELSVPRVGFDNPRSR